MRHWLKVLMVVLLLCLAAAIPLAMQRTAGPQGGAIEGTLMDEAGPVAGAIVQAQHSGSGTMKEVITDQRGFYRLSELPRGWYSLWIVSAKHNSVSVPRVFIEEGATTRKDLRMISLSRSESALP